MVDVSKVTEILERHGAKRERMIAILLDCQETYYHLPREVLEAVAAGVRVPLTSVLAVATFFKAFSLTPIGRHPIRVCNGTACNIQGGPLLVDALERELKIRKGETTADGLFGLDTVNCVGCCGLAPVVTVGPDVHGKVKIASVPKMIKQYQPKTPAEPKEGSDAPTVH
ncbi:MAG: NAD(P)H-dependent oxidoreductase subunit E [Acidobacteriota bacterium]|nr:NAD(P)H-dependent oxidoreductase subunit E [Acidobacteriota bacterium]